MNGMIELELNGRKVMVIGGPYREKPLELKGVKLAKEIDAPYDLALDIADFSVPDEAECYVKTMEALAMLDQVDCIYVGCMGGIGRTGLFMALLVKATGYYNMEFEHTGWRGRINRIKKFFGFPDGATRAQNMITHPVEFVRHNYLAGAVETQEQYEFVNNFEWNQWELIEEPVLGGIQRTAARRV